LNRVAAPASRMTLLIERIYRVLIAVTRIADQLLDN